MAPRASNPPTPQVALPSKVGPSPSPGPGGRPPPGDGTAAANPTTMASDRRSEVDDAPSMVPM